MFGLSITDVTQPVIKNFTETKHRFIKNEMGIKLYNSCIKEHLNFSPQ
jgi:hypothetical protein